MRYGSGEAGAPIALWGAALRLTHPTLKTPMAFVSKPEGKAFAPFDSAVDAFLAQVKSAEPNA